MKHLFRQSLVALLTLMVLGSVFVLPLATVFASPPPGGFNGNSPPPGGFNGNNPPPGGFNGGGGFRLENPLKFGSLCELIDGLLTIIIEVGAIIAVILIIYNGFTFVQAMGNPEKIKVAKRSFMYTLIGTGILLGASAIAKLVFTTIMNITGGPGSAGAC